MPFQLALNGCEEDKYYKVVGNEMGNATGSSMYKLAQARFQIRLSASKY